jgi:hypothetical protein
MADPHFRCLVAGLLTLQAAASAFAEGKKGKSPVDELPPHIRRVTWFGERADWSHDGKRILFLAKTFGDVYELELATGTIRPMTHHYFHAGYTRALYLANGDLLLSGAPAFDPKNPWKSRHEDQAELWVLKKDLSAAAVRLGENCSEGPAVSRRTMRIAWTRHNAIHMAEVVYEDGKPRLAGRKTVLDAKDLPFKCGLETQNFRPPEEKELTFSAYGYQGTEVMGLDLDTGKVVNYSNAPNQYDEPEGIFPDGKHTLVECDRHCRKGAGHIDLYKLALDGSIRTERLTFFNDYPGYKASNPVVSDDGRFIAFQLAKSNEAAGIGHGILVFDLDMYEKTKPTAQAADPPASKLPPLQPLFDYPLRDTSVCVGGDGLYYLTGTTGHPTWWKTNEGIRVWQSADLKKWEPLGLVWKIDDGTWQKEKHGENRALWAPEIHYIKGTFWLTHCLNFGGTGLLKSTSGKAQGPYVDVHPKSPLTGNIDASLFADDDGKVYFVWQNGMIARLNDDMTELAEKPQLLKPSNHTQVGFEGAFLTKINKQYYLVCAEFLGGDYHCMIAQSDKIYGPYGPRYLAVPHGGHNMLFKDKEGQWWATFFGNDAHAPFRERPGMLRIEFDAAGQVKPKG